MNNFLPLYLYEMKKLLSRKLVWISWLIILLLEVAVIISPFIGDYYIDGEKADSNMDMYITDANYEKSFNQKPLNQALIDEAWAAYSKVPMDIDGEKHYSSTSEYQDYARPYSSVVRAVCYIAGIQNIKEAVVNWNATEDEMYEKRKEYLEGRWNAYYLTEAEKEFWRKEEEKIQKPFVLNYCDGYATFAWNIVIGVGAYSIIAAAVCLAGIFTDETARRTDQLILCSKNGRARLYYVKIAAGISLSVLGVITVLAISAIINFSIYGIDGFNTAIQLILESSYNLSIGSTVIIMTLVSVISVICAALFTMLLSQLVRSNIATLATITMIFLLTMFVNIPNHCRVLSQIIDYIFPSRFLMGQYAIDTRLIKIGDILLMPYYAVPVMYIVLGICFVLIGGVIYRRQEINGR